MKWTLFAKTRGDEFKEGDWNVIDDRSGRKVKASATGLQWDGMRTVKPQKRHEQDFLRGRPERIKTPWTRIEENVFVNGAFVATNDAGSGKV